MKSLRDIGLFMFVVFLILVMIPALFSQVLIRHHIDQLELLFVTPSTPSSAYLHLFAHDLLDANTKLLDQHDINCSRKYLEDGATICSKSTPNFKSTDFKDLYGIYLHDKKRQDTFYQIHSYDQYPNKVSKLRTLIESWLKSPSAASIATSLQEPLQGRRERDKQRQTANTFYHDIERWCFETYHPPQGTNHTRLCTATVSSDTTIGNRSIYLQGQVPLFTFDENVSVGRVFLSFPAANRIYMKQSSQGSSIWKFWGSEFIGTSGIRKNPNRNNAETSYKNNQDTLYDFFLRHPTTYLLLFVNIAFAIFLSYKQIHPENVSISFVTIIERHEYWRCWSGSLAHFEPWHLIFNMSSLYSLGINLENVFQFMSMPFLLMNISLMFWTTMVEMGLLYCRIYWMQRNHPEVIVEVKRRQAVGFSGVLFAWMVLDCLERSQTCPIPFYPSVCFTTHSVAGGWIKFNIGPFVSLIVCQFLIPRASFIGHLSGILCGFFLHWKVLPTNLAWSPEVLMPLLFLLDWWLIRKLVSFKHGFIVSNLDRASWGSDDYDERLDIRQSALDYGKIIMVISCAISFITFNILGTICLPQSIITILFYFTIDAYEKSYTWQQTSMRSITGIIYRGIVVALTISIVVHAFSFGSILGAGVHTQYEYNIPFGVTMAVTILLSLIVINFVALLLICSILCDYDNIEARSDGFSFVYGRMMKNSHYFMEWIEDRLLRHRHEIHGRR